MALERVNHGSQSEIQGKGVARPAVETRPPPAQENVLARNVATTDYQIDHLMLGASDLGQGKAWVKNQFGLPAIDGGRHPSQGTRNALLGLAEDCYLEVIAPDPTQGLSGTLAEQLLGYTTPHLRTFAVRCSSFEDLVLRVEAFGFGHRVLEMSRETITGGQLTWRLLFVEIKVSKR